jgi:hypothetical protein
MRLVDPGVQWTSRLTGRTRIAAILLGLALVLPAAAASPSPATAANGYILMSRSTLMSRPMSGSAWRTMKAVADGSLGTPNLCDQHSKHHLRTFASALVYARTGISRYGLKARQGVMAAIRTLRIGCDNATLSLGRQLMAYVLAADFANLTGTPDRTFRAWLRSIRTRIVGGHGVWNSLLRTHVRSAANWGAYAGASRIAASLYLGDRSDVLRASRVTRGFLGSRTAFRFRDNLSSSALSWSCAPRVYTPVNGRCWKRGILVDGAVVADVGRGGSLRWPPGSVGMQYQLESIQGVGLQVELLYQNGYRTAYTWSASALRRMANFVTRSRSGGGIGWNGTLAARQMPWLLNRRYGLRIPTAPSRMGRAIGFTDWLWGR